MLCVALLSVWVDVLLLALVAGGLWPTSAAAEVRVEELSVWVMDVLQLVLVANGFWPTSAAAELRVEASVCQRGLV